MDDHHKVRLRLTARGQGSTAVVDDMEIRNLLSVSTECGYGKMTTVTLTFYADVESVGEVAEVVTSAASESRHLRSDQIR